MKPQNKKTNETGSTTKPINGIKTILAIGDTHGKVPKKSIEKGIIASASRNCINNVDSFVSNIKAIMPTAITDNQNPINNVLSGETTNKHKTAQHKASNRLILQAVILTMQITNNINSARWVGSEKPAIKA
jgi:hypothetical protein